MNAFLIQLAYWFLVHPLEWFAGAIAYLRWLVVPAPSPYVPGKPMQAILWGPNLDNPPPVGQGCAWCGELIAGGDEGQSIPHIEHDVAPGLVAVSMLPYHRDCLLRILVGSVDHQARRCKCFGGPGGCETQQGSRREQARRAAMMWRSGWPN